MKKFVLAIKEAPNRLHRRMVGAMVALTSFCLSVVPAFASTPSNSDFVVTSTDLDPLLTSIVANIRVVFPVIMVITGIFIVVALVPRLLRNAAKGN